MSIPVFGAQLLTSPVGGGGSGLWVTADNGTDRSALLANPRNTAGADSIVEASVGGTSAGDPIFRLRVTGGVFWDILVDNDNADVLDILRSGNSQLRISDIGVIINTNGDNPTQALDIRKSGGVFNAIAQIHGGDGSGIDGFHIGHPAVPNSQIQLYRFGGAIAGNIFGTAKAGWAALMAQSSSNGWLIGTVGADPVWFGTTDIKRMEITSDGDIEFGAGLATTAVAGFPCMPSCAGVPTGVPTPAANLIPFIYDRTNDDFYAYNAGWHIGAMI